MANTKISALPTWSGTAADLRWFVMNNSGNTETFKFSGYTSPFKTAAGTNNSNNIYDTIVMGGINSSIVGGVSNTIPSGSYNFIGGGSSNSVQQSGGAIVGGFSNTNNDSAGFIGGGRVLTAGGSGSDSNYAIGGAYGTAQGIGGGILGAWGTYVYDDANNSDPYRRPNIIVGSPYSEIGISSSVGRNFAGIYSSLYSYIRGTSASPTTAVTILGSSASTIGAGVKYSTIIAGALNTLSSTTDKSAIIGGSGNTISGRTNAVMVGCSGRTASDDNTTFVENLHTFRTPSTQVQPILTGTTFTCNLNNGAKSQFYITGTSTINITNVRDGASFMIKTQTDGNYVMTWAATGGYTFVFEGGLKDPGNNVTDIFVFEVFGSVIYGNRRHNYS